MLPDLKELEKIHNDTLASQTDQNMGSLPDLNELQAIHNESAKQEEFANRGFVRGLASDVAGGVVSTFGEQIPQALRAAGKITGSETVENMATPMIEGTRQYIEEHPFLQPDPTSTGFAQTVHSGVRSVAQSLATHAIPTAVGATVGALYGGGPIGAIAGGTAGAVTGYVAGGAPVFGLSRYDDVIERADKAGIPRSESEPIAIKEALAETGFEYGSDILDVLLLGHGRLLTAPGKEALKEGISSMFGRTLKQRLGTMAGIAGAEIPMEMATSAVEADQEKKLGLGSQSAWEAAKEAFGPTLVASMIFGGLGEAGIHLDKKRVQHALENPKVNPESRMRAADEIYSTLSQVDPAIADVWGQTASAAIDENKPITMNQDLHELHRKITNIEKTPEKTRSATQNGNLASYREQYDSILRDMAGATRDEDVEALYEAQRQRVAPSPEPTKTLSQQNDELIAEQYQEEPVAEAQRVPDVSETFRESIKPGAPDLSIQNRMLMEKELGYSQPQINEMNAEAMDRATQRAPESVALDDAVAQLQQDEATYGSILPGVASYRGPSLDTLTRQPLREVTTPQEVINDRQSESGLASPVIGRQEEPGGTVPERGAGAHPVQLGVADLRRKLTTIPPDLQKAGVTPIESAREARELLDAVGPRMGDESLDKYLGRIRERQEGVVQSAQGGQEEVKSPKQVHDYSSTQVDLPEEHARAVRDVGLKIPDSELYIDPEDASYGREEEPHITVKYGLHTADAKKVAPILKGVGPITVKLGKISTFKGDKYDVVKVDVDSPSLHALNKKIAENTKVTDTHPEYNPHVTIAYVKKGEAKKYIGDKSLKGREITFDSLTFSGKNGDKVTLSLGGKEQATPTPTDTERRIQNIEKTPEQNRTPQQQSNLERFKKAMEASMLPPIGEAKVEQPNQNKDTSPTQSVIDSFISQHDKEKNYTDPDTVQSKDLLMNLAERGLVKSADIRNGSVTAQTKDGNTLHANFRDHEDAVNYIRNVIGIEPNILSDVGSQPTPHNAPQPKNSEQSISEQGVETKVAQNAQEGSLSGGEVKYSLEYHPKVSKRIAAGDITAEELKAEYQNLLNNEQSIRDELNKRTVKQLAPNGTFGKIKKSEIVDSILDRMKKRFVVKDSFSWSPMEETHSDALNRVVNATTDEDIQAAAKNRADNVAQMKKALTNPETLSEFRDFIAHKGAQSLSTDQRVKYDELLSKQAKTVKGYEEDRKSIVKGVNLGTVNLKYQETTHTKTGAPLHVVQLSEKVEKDIYTELNRKARQLGGWYSSYRKDGAVPGFQFNTKDAADKFMALQEGDVSRKDLLEEKQQERTGKKVERLRTQAENLAFRANESLNRDRNTNTARRAEMASSAEASARADLAMSETMHNLADAIESGEATHLDGVGTKADIDTLDSALRRAKQSYEREKNITYAESQKRSVSLDDIQAAEYPFPYVHRSRLMDVIKTLSDLKGSKQLASKIQKIMDAVTTEAKDYGHITNPADIETIREASTKSDNYNFKALKESLTHYDRLKRMGIDDLPSLRAALREYLTYRGKQQAPDKIKEIERSMIGKKLGVDFFPTPKAVAEDMVARADIEPGMKVLEPSAGNGNIAEAIRNAGTTPDVVELSGDLRDLLREKKFNVVEHDFMDLSEGGYDRIVMNPPFSKNQDIEHVQHAYDLLNPGGKIVAIIGEGAFFREGKTEKAFRDWLEQVGAKVEKLPGGTFKDKDLLAQTGVNARMVEIEKPNGSAESLTISEKGIPNEDAKELIRRTLQAEQDKGNPAVSSFPNIIKKSGKYEIVHENDKYTLKKNNDLSVSGFNRSLERHYDPTGEFGSFNEAAKEYMDSVFAEREARQKAAQTEIENKRKKEEEEARLLAENEQQISDSMKNVKSRQQTITIKKTEGTEDIKAKVIGDYAYHRPLGYNDSRYAKKNGPQWQITHIPSGIGLGEADFLVTESDAKELAYRLSMIPDKWDGKGNRPSAAFSNAVTNAAHEFMDRKPFGNSPTSRASLSESQPSTGITIQELDSHIEPILAKWKNAPKIVPVQTVEDIPASVKDGFGTIIGTNERIRGLYHPESNSVYMIAGNIKDSQDAQETLLHEGFHGSIRDVLGNKLDPFLKETFAYYGKKGLDPIAKAYKLDLSMPSDRMIAAEEKIAQLAETGERPGFLKRLYGAIRDALRAMGFTIKINDADIQRMIVRTQRNLEREPVHGNMDVLRRLNEATSGARNATLENDWDISNFGENGVRFSVASEAEARRLESEEHIKVFRAMQLIDGKLYPPMSAKINGKLRRPTEIGQWEVADENPELATNDGKFKLYKGNKKYVEARYNPYFHTSSSPLNDQFSEAYNRPNLVTVEVAIPKSELTSGYKAEKAKDAVGEMNWHKGPVSAKLPPNKKRTVILSRYAKVLRIVPDAEVADHIAGLLHGENLSVPWNVITPSLKEELIKRGVDVASPPTQTTRFSIKQTASDELHSVMSAIDEARHPEDATLFQTVLQSPEWRTDPNERAAFQATQEREDRKNEIFMKHIAAHDALAALKFKGMNWFQKAKTGFYDKFHIDSRLPKDYLDAAQILDRMDTEEIPWDELKPQVEGNVSQEVIDTVSQVRKAYDDILEMQRQPVKDIIDQMERGEITSINLPGHFFKNVAKSDLELLKRETGMDSIREIIESDEMQTHDEIELSNKKRYTRDDLEAIRREFGYNLSDAINFMESKNTESTNIALPSRTYTKNELLELYHAMGELKGFFSPRIRPPGDFYVTGKDANGQFPRYHEPTRRLAEKRKLALAREGLTDLEVGQIAKLPEDVYQDLNIIDMGKAIEHAIETSNIGSEEAKAALKGEALLSASNVIKARGFRAHKISRTARKENLVRGYLVDPLERYTLYLNQIAGGIAKGEAAMKMYDALAKVPASTQPKRYERLRNYIIEQLRNPDRVDRMVAQGKAIVAFKYLGINPRSAFVNTTAQITTVPPSILKYALDNNGSLTKIMGALYHAGKDYTGVMLGKKLSNKKEQEFMDDIHAKGYDQPKLARDAMRNIQDALGSTWSKVMEGSMWMFGKTEQWNRGSTMLAAYRLAKTQGATHEVAMEKARLASDKAHGIYGKGSLPAWAQGANPFAKFAQMGYSFSKFSHSYLQMLYDHGISKETAKGLAFALLSPAAVGGASAFVGYSVLLGVAKGIMRALGDDREPEKMFWDTVRENLGSGAEKVGRYGAAGALGVDLTGTLAIGMQLPKNVLDLIGPFGGVAQDIGSAAHFAATGQPGKAVERIVPTQIGNIMRASREYLNGATTTAGNRVWDEDGKPYMPSVSEAIKRASGFRASDRATFEARQREAKVELMNFSEARTSIYEEYRAYLSRSQKDPQDLKGIMDRIARYNKSVQSDGRTAVIPMITRQSMQRQVMKMRNPTRRQKMMLLSPSGPES